MLVLTEPSAQYAASSRAGAERLGQRRDLDRVAERGAGAVRLDVGDRVRLDPATACASRDDRGLPVDARRGVADLVGAVVVDGRAADHRVDRVAVGQRVGEPLQHDDAGAVAATVPGASASNARQCPSGEQDAALAVEDNRCTCGTLTERRRPAPCRTRRSSRLWHARCTATSDVEHAVCTFTLGPRRFSL